MARAGFYNDNEYRDYPFLTQTQPLDVTAVVTGSSSSLSLSSLSSQSSEAPVPLVGLPHESIVDFGAIMAVDSGFKTKGDFVYLHRIYRKDPYLLFEFRNTATYAKSEKLVFIRHISASEFKYSWAESVPIEDPDSFPESSSSSAATPPEAQSSSSSSISSYSCPFCPPAVDADTLLPCGGPGCDTSKWEGFLITGMFGEILDTLAHGEEITFVTGVWVIEYARIQNLNNAYARSVNLGNIDRAHATPPEHCVAASETAVDVYPNAICMQGALQFREGYNCNIRQEDNNNAIVITGAVGGGGAGYPCDEIPLYDGETAPNDSPFLSGGPACGEVVRTISGKEGPAVRIYGGPGIRVYDSPEDPSALFVDADLGDFALCLQEELQPDDPCYVSSSSAAGGP